MKRFFKEKEEDIIRSYLSGMTQYEIAKKYGTFNTSIRRVLNRYNISIKSNAILQRYVLKNPFKKGDPLSDYFLGLLISDGCISTGGVTIGLKEEDVYMLENFARFLSPKMNVNKYIHKKYKTYQYYIKFRNIEIQEYLQNQANFVDKSHKAEIYCSLNWNILRGIFDGDGSIITPSRERDHIIFSITSASEILINQINDFFISNNYNSSIYEYNPQINNPKLSKIYYLRISRKKDLLRLFIDLYKGSDTYLIRKYQKLATFVEKSTKKNTLNSGNDTLLTLSETSLEGRAETIIGAPKQEIVW